MVRFESTFRIGVLHQEIALVLHHASIWSRLSQVDLVVDAGSNGPHKAGTLHPWDLALDLTTEGRHVSDLEQLFGYLARILPLDYEVALVPGHVCVAFDSHRRPALLVPMFAQPPVR